MSIISQKESVSAPFLTLVILPSSSYQSVVTLSEQLRGMLDRCLMENTGM